TDQGPELATFSYGRMVKALEVYRSCKSRSQDCRIVSSGGDTRSYGKSEAELYAEELERLGAARADLIVEGRSMNTWQNAQFTAEILAGEKFDQVVLVTSGMHVRRSLLYFYHFGIYPMGIRADYAYARLSVIPVAYNILLADVAIHEYLGVLRYHVYNALGWNVKAAKPGAL
ncbi:MAG: YdcF family protein, partial [Steroidobacter sp.]